jgi:hypothetical protein
MKNRIVKSLLSFLIAPDRLKQKPIEEDEALSVRAERFRAYVVPCTFESELQQLEDHLQSGTVTFGEFVILRAGQA